MNPYKSIPARSRWMKAVAGSHPLSIAEWYEKKFEIANGPIAAAGSCFAQHIGRHLKASGFSYVDTERAPPWMPGDVAAKFGYGMYSARFGNVYSPLQLCQLIERAFGERKYEEAPWKSDGGYVDPFRPTIEPPLESQRHVEVSRDLHLKNVALIFQSAKTFIFTLGLTETWVNKETGAAYPLCPGTRGGEFDSSKHAFVNFDYQAVVSDLETFLRRFRAIRKDGQVIFTVSPVSLMATAGGGNVVVATSYSKAVLRAAAGYLAEKYEFVDYFPSYEIIASTPMRGMFFEPDMREVNPYGVEHVMRQFFSQHRPIRIEPQEEKEAEEVSGADAICDEILLEMVAEK